MKLYVCHHPRAVILAKDKNQARVLLKQRLNERGIRKRRPELDEVSTHVPRVILPPPAEPDHVVA